MYVLIYILRRVAKLLNIITCHTSLQSLECLDAQILRN